MGLKETGCNNVNWIQLAQDYEIPGFLERVNNCIGELLNTSHEDFFHQHLQNNFISQAYDAMKAYWRSGGTAPCIL
jgi:hypothetical protein